MGITKIGSLFAANIDSVPAVKPTPGIAPQQTPTQVASQTSSDAVVLSKSLQTSQKVPLADAESARAAKVDKLKQQVKSGTYKPSSDAVAVAVLRDLA
jgi:flagellar biosynthesis anti-sigma factor FlgM